MLFPEGMDSRKNIVVVAGGRSVEHGISLQSARALEEGLAHSERYRVTTVSGDFPGSFEAIRAADYVLPLVHGDQGAGLHGLLALLDLPVLGEGPGASAVALDKPVAKRLLREAGLPVVRGLVVSRRELAARPREIVARIAREVGFPCFVKPACGVASVGASSVSEAGLLLPALVGAATFDTRILVEPFLDVREIEVGFLDGLTSLPGELVFRAEFHDFETKTTPGKLELVIPAMVSERDRDRVQALASQACAALGIDTVARVELFVDRNTREILVNEVNAVPCFAPAAPFHRLWEASGLGLEPLIGRLVAAADAHMRDLFRTQRSLG